MIQRLRLRVRQIFYEREAASGILVEPNAHVI